MGIGVEAVIVDHDLSFIRNMGGHTSDKPQIVHPLFLGLAFIILIANLAFYLIERGPLERKQEADHVFAHAFSLFSVSGSDFAVNVESSMPPGENLLHKGETDELFSKQKRENFMGKELLNEVIIEVGNTVKGTI